MKKMASWKGYISFGLINIQIELYSAVKEHTLGFKLLHSKCKTPVTYKRWCNNCDEEVQWNNVVKGIKLENDQYFIITQENLKKLRPEKDDNLNIIEFIATEQLDPIYFDKNFYIIPARTSDRAFYLFTEALKQSNKLAIGQFVLKDKQHVCAIKPYNGSLLLTTLNYDYEIKKLNIPKEAKPHSFEKKEIALAQELIQKFTVKKFDMSKFKDTFAQELKKHINQVSKGKIAKSIPKHIKPTHQASLIKILESSLKKTKIDNKTARA